MYEQGSGGSFGGEHRNMAHSEGRIDFNTPTPEELYMLRQSPDTRDYTASLLGKIKEMFDRGVSHEEIRTSIVEMYIAHTGGLGNGDGELVNDVFANVNYTSNTINNLK